MSRPYLLMLHTFSLALLAQIGCTSAPNFWEEAKPGQKKILVSFPPLYCITHAIAGDDAYVLSLLTTEGPHDYDGAATDPLKVADADLVISNGLGLDDVFVKKMLRNKRNPSLQELNVGEALARGKRILLPDKGHFHEDGKLHIHGTNDPHVWLGPDEAAEMAQLIAGKLADIDPKNVQNYAKRADQFIAELQKLKERGEAAFKGKKSRKLVTMHESLGYFAKCFDLEVVGSIQIKPGTDPEAKSMANLIELCKKEQVRVFAVEPQYSTAQAETLQRSLKQHKLDVAIVRIDPLETAAIPKGRRFNPDPDIYLKTMRENIDKLAEALP